MSYTNAELEYEADRLAASNSQLETKPKGGLSHETTSRELIEHYAGIVDTNLPQNAAKRAELIESEFLRFPPEKIMFLADKLSREGVLTFEEGEYFINGSVLYSKSMGNQDLCEAMWVKMKDIVGTEAYNKALYEYEASLETSNNGNSMFWFWIVLILFCVGVSLYAINTQGGVQGLSSIITDEVLKILPNDSLRVAGDINKKLLEVLV